MFKSIKEFIFGKPAPAEAAPAEVAPYKVPEPAATTPIPLVVEAELPLVKLEQVSAPVVETQITDAVTQTPAKKPRKPRTPKAVVETAVVKKAAPVKKAAAMKAAPKTSKSKKA